MKVKNRGKGVLRLPPHRRVPAGATSEVSPQQRRVRKARPDPRIGPAGPPRDFRGRLVQGVPRDSKSQGGQGIQGIQGVRGAGDQGIKAQGGQGGPGDPGTARRSVPHKQVIKMVTPPRAVKCAFPDRSGRPLRP